MRELRLIGVHDDGEHLLLTEDGDNRFTVPIDAALRSALKRAAVGRSADVDAVQVPEDLRPRDVQALLRAGASVADVAERAGWTVEKVERYEGPIRAEREHIAGLARAIAVSGGAAGRTDSTFGERVEQRLDGRGVDSDDVVWDSWRGRDGGWTVLCSFPAGGRQRRATWSFDARSRTLEPNDDEARWLGEDEGAPGPLSAASVREASVYDVEAEGGLNASASTQVRRVRGGRTSATAVPSQQEPASTPAPRSPAKGKGTAKDAPEPAERPVDLVAAMRERSKNRRRKGKAAAQHDFPEDAAPREKLDTTGAPPPMGSHPSDDELADAEGAAEVDDKPSVDDLGRDPVTGTADLFADLDGKSDAAKTDAAKPDDASAAQVADAPDDGAAGDDSSEDRAAEEEAAEEESSDEAGSQDADSQRDAGRTAVQQVDAATPIPDRPSSARKGRPSVPSWDDIMFGRRPGRD